ncbi:RelA/SpoT domain-containing protein, partial [Candidatus Magnetominusculus xianensis]|uniref:RelA/SpoT domain-containing protein n=1 Tax=Candidatus Magnetominusculus xianensis TaxID=1748249 RepID=UPI000A0F6492
MSLSKSKIDRAGGTLAKQDEHSEENLREAHNIFDQYRKSHLQPLTDCTIKLQNLISSLDVKYYIAQRLKRKPQIIRKLNRFSVRLTQLQDIGGCRIVVNENKDVDKVKDFIKEKIAKGDGFFIKRVTDYRENGRDDTGYRALHVLLDHSGHALELQIRSQIQHYWSESIERTSVIYGYRLKEKEGDGQVINYFKNLSTVFHEIESGRNPSPQQKIDIDLLREKTENIIQLSDGNRILNSYVNTDIIQTLISKEKKRSGFNNWVIVFDWNTGSFITWDIVSRDTDKASQKYVEYEQQYPAHDGFEVVMIGSSDVATIQQTHSHYFGISSYDSVLEHLDQSVVGFSRRIDIDSDARQILLALHNRKF